MFPNLDKATMSSYFSFISTLAMEDEQRHVLGRLVLLFELRYAEVGPEKAAHDSRLADLERKIRQRAAACNDPAMKCPRLVDGLWYFGPNDK